MTSGAAFLLTGTPAAAHGLYFDGGGSVDTPDNANWSPAVSWDFRIDYAADDATPGNLQTLAAHWSIFGGQGRGWFFNIQPTTAPKPGNFNFELGTADGTAWFENYAPLAAATQLPTRDNQRVEFQCIYLVDEGATGDRSCRFYHRPGAARPLTDNTGWAEIGTQDGATRTGTFTPHNSSAVFSMGANNGGSGNRFAGSIYRAALYVDGTLVADPDWTSSAQRTTATTWTDTLGNVWTLRDTTKWR